MLSNVVTEVIGFDPLYVTCFLTTRRDDEYCPPAALHGGTQALKKHVLFHKVPQTIQDWRKTALTAGCVATKYLPYILHKKTDHVLTVTPSGWNTTESEHLHNTICVLPEIQRRRAIKNVDCHALVTSDNYVAHHNLEAVKTELKNDKVLSLPLKENSTDLVQWCDTDLNSCLKVKQKKMQGEQLYDSLLE